MTRTAKEPTAPAASPCCAAAEEYAAAADWADDVSGVLFAALMRLDLSARSVLEIGCGYGRLLVGAVVAGASRGTGLDLDDEAIDGARERATAAGVGERIDLADADAVEVPLHPHDVVVLDRVICCEPQGDLLVRRSLAAARWAYAMTVPESRGVRGAWNRIVSTAEALWSRVTGEGRVYVHDIAQIERRIHAAGFRLHHAERSGRWFLAIYVRDPRPAG